MLVFISLPGSGVLIYVLFGRGRKAFRAGFHIHSRLRRLDDLGAAPMPISGLPAREWGDVGRQDLGPDRDGGRAVRGTGRARAGASAGETVRVLAALRRFLREGTP